MASLTSRTRCRPLGFPCATVLFAWLLMPATVATAAPKWALIYYRQLGNIENANGLTIENHVFRENGAKASGVGVTNLYNAGSAIFGNTDSDGWNRINPLDVNNCKYDIRIHDPSTPTDNTPDFFFQNPPASRYYSFITHWMYVSDAARMTPRPTTPAYHYDLVNGLNQVSGLNPANCVATTFTEPPGAGSDAKTLTTWSDYQAQTFVVPQGINRIVSAQAFVVRQGGVHFTYRAGIRLGSPTGLQIGPLATSRDVVSTQFKEVAVCWDIDDVPVTPGQTYALRLEAGGGDGFNVYATTADNYAQGSLYNGATQRPGQDMLAVVVGLWYDAAAPHINRNPATLSRSVVRKNNLPNDTFTIANGGAGTLTYTVSEDVSWLSIDSTSGTSTGEADTINLSYDTAGLAIGPYSGTITIDASGADNTPETVVVNLSVTAPPFAPCDFDLDHDVDQVDFGVFQSCYSGAGNKQTNQACAGARLDLDEDVDERDFEKFAACMSGSGVLVVTTCAD